MKALAAPALPARISQIHSSTDSGGRKSVRSAIARMIPDTKPACASSMGRFGHDVNFIHCFDVQRIEIGFHAHSPQNSRNLAGRDDDLREPALSIACSSSAGSASERIRRLVRANFSKSSGSTWREILMRSFEQGTSLQRNRSVIYPGSEEM